MADGKTYWICDDCGEVTNGADTKPCRCMREWRREREDERLAKAAMEKSDG